MKNTSTIPPGYLLAWIALTCGTIMLLGTAIMQPPTELFHPLAYLALSFISLGTGEIFNHPQGEVRELGENQNLEEVRINKRRQRNVCSLGNIFDVVAILLFFIATAKFFFRH